MTSGSSAVGASYGPAPRRRVVQFWHDLSQLPNDVEQCIASWRGLEQRGFEVALFDDERARSFITSRLGVRYSKAYDRCYHPAMRSDFFRLCFVLVEGGCYVDADDVYHGDGIQDLFCDGRLKVQPLCFDMATSQMVPPSSFTKPGTNSSDWIFYFNNNPVLAAAGHPVLQRALANAMRILEDTWIDGLPEIQSTTGPGNLTRSIFELALEDSKMANALVVLRGWGDVATSKWPLSYRSDARNWRLSNGRTFYGGAAEGEG